MLKAAAASSRRVYPLEVGAVVFNASASSQGWGYRLELGAVVSGAGPSCLTRGRRVEGEAVVLEAAVLCLGRRQRLELGPSCSRQQCRLSRFAASSPDGGVVLEVSALSSRWPGCLEVGVASESGVRSSK
jgi:hypothetical protein